MTPIDNTKIGSAAVNNETAIWMGIAVGVVVGIGIAVSRRKKSRWDTARALTNRVTERSSDLVDATLELAGRIRNAIEESCKAVEGPGHLWKSGRKLVRH
jgi:hypothetical protein